MATYTSTTLPDGAYFDVGVLDYGSLWNFLKSYGMVIS